MKVRWPFVFEAQQWSPGKKMPRVCASSMRSGEGVCESIDGPVRVRRGDWVLYYKGECWVVSDLVFKKCYEEVRE